MKRRLFYNGTIRTMDPDCPLVEALLVEGKRIAAVGRYADLAPAAKEGGETVDLKGKTLLPGFNDAHIHIWKVGHLLTGMLDLRGVRSIQELQERLEQFSRRFDGEWIVGRGFNEAMMAEGRLPDCRDLDAVVPDRPVFLIRTCAHIGIANSVALKQSDIGRGVTAPTGGFIETDGQDLPTGMLAETAMGLIQKHIPPPAASDYRRMIQSAGQALLAAGVTSATDPAVLPDLMEVYRSMHASGELPLRVNTLAIRLPDGGTEPLPLPEKTAGDWFRSEGVKFFADGGLSGQTAALRQPYRNSNNRGMLRLEAESFYRMAKTAHEQGYRIGTHAIGDAAIDLVLDVYHRLYRECGKGQRHRIEHLGLPHDEQLKRIKAMALIAVPQAIFLRELGGNFRKYLPDPYLQRCYPLRSVLDHGIPIALSSDAPVVRSIHPLAGMAAAADRLDERGHPIGPQEAIHLAEALQAYTVGGAAAEGALDQKGSLQPGKWADMVVLNRDPLTGNAEEHKNIQVEQVFIDGIMRWRQADGKKLLGK